MDVSPLPPRRNTSPYPFRPQILHYRPFLVSFLRLLSPLSHSFLQIIKLYLCMFEKETNLTFKLIYYACLQFFGNFGEKIMFLLQILRILWPVEF